MFYENNFKLYCLQYSYREKYCSNSDRCSLSDGAICINKEEQDSAASLSKAKVR